MLDASKILQRRAPKFSRRKKKQTSTQKPSTDKVDKEDTGKRTVLKRRRSTYFAWKSVKNLAQQQCLLNSGLTGVTNQATKEEKLGRKQK